MKTFELPYGCKVKCKLVDHKWVEQEVVLTYRWMDWSYWRFVDDDWNSYPAYWTHKLEWDFYIFA